MLEIASLVVTALTGLLGVLLGGRAATRMQAEADRRQEARELRRQAVDQQQREAQLVARYQEPLARAAYDLQGRLWNVLNKGYLETYLDRPDRAQKTYARESTVWLLAQYLGWVEIVRREAQLLPLEHQDARRSVNGALDHVVEILSTDEQFDERFRIFRPQQRAVGELMIVAGQDAEGSPRTDCMGFARFVETLKDPAEPLAMWLAPVLSDVRPVEQRTRGRLVALQRGLVALLDVIDAERVRFPRSRASSH